MREKADYAVSELASDDIGINGGGIGCLKAFLIWITYSGGR